MKEIIQGVQQALLVLFKFTCTPQLALRQAYQERIIREDVANLLGNIPKRDTRKEFLTLDEVKQLAATPCQHEVLKRAALFSCLRSAHARSRRYSAPTVQFGNI